MVVDGNLRNVPGADFGNVNFEDVQLIPHECKKNLGVILDSSLRFRPHIESMIRTCNFHICNLYMVKPFITKRNLITLVHSLIVSNVNYCNSLLAWVTKCNFKESSVHFKYSGNVDIFPASLGFQYVFSN